MAEDPQLRILDVAFHGIEEMQPASFSPGVTEYSIQPGRGHTLSFHVLTNLATAAPNFTTFVEGGTWDNTCKVWVGCSAEQFARADPQYVNRVKMQFGYKTLRIGFQANANQFASAVYQFNVNGIHWTAEETEQCRHLETKTCEGEVWGGASGSCTVEMTTDCCDCGKELNKWYDHRD